MFSFGLFSHSRNLFVIKSLFYFFHLLGVELSYALRFTKLYSENSLLNKFHNSRRSGDAIVRIMLLIMVPLTLYYFSLFTYFPAVKRVKNYYSNTLTGKRICLAARGSCDEEGNGGIGVLLERH